MKSFHVYWKSPEEDPRTPPKKPWEQRHPRLFQLIAGIFCLSWGAFMGMATIATLRQGSFVWRGSHDIPITPTQHPFQFWGMVSFGITISLFVLWTALRALIQACRRQVN